MLKFVATTLTLLGLFTTYAYADVNPARSPFKQVSGQILQRTNSATTNLVNALDIDLGVDTIALSLSANASQTVNIIEVNDSGDNLVLYINSSGDLVIDGVQVDFEAGSSEGFPRLAQSSTPPSAACDAAEEAGRLYFDSDLDTNGSVMVCTGAGGWKDIDDDGGVAGHGDGDNCDAGEIALGVDENGAVQGCYEPAFTDLTGTASDAQVAGVNERDEVCNTTDLDASCNIRTNVITRTEIDETQFSIQTHATNCTLIDCDTASNGELCYERDDDDLYVCEDDGTPAWEQLVGGIDSRYVAVTGDTMTGELDFGHSQRINDLQQGTGGIPSLEVGNNNSGLFGPDSGASVGISASGTEVLRVAPTEIIAYQPLNMNSKDVELAASVQFDDDDVDPACNAGDYNIFADLSETEIKKCVNGTISDLDTGGTEVNDLTAAVTWANVPDANVTGASERDEVCNTTDLDATCNVRTNVITRTEIDETQFSIQTHATNCTLIDCDETSNGELCYERDDNTLYVCEDDGTPAWEQLVGGLDSRYVAVAGDTMEGDLDFNHSNRINDLQQGTGGIPSLEVGNNNSGLFAPDSGASVGISASGTEVLRAAPTEIIAYQPLNMNSKDVELAASVQFDDDDVDPACTAGDYNIFADLSETTLKKCVNGVKETLVHSNGDNCLAGNYPLGVDENGAVESCTAVPSVPTFISEAATGSGTSWSLSQTPTSSTSVTCALAGYVMTRVGSTPADNEFTVSGTSVTLGLSANAGDDIICSYTY